MSATVIRRRMWRKPYDVSERSEFHLGQLQRFVRVLNTDYESALSFRGDILTLMYDEPIERIRKDYPNAESAVLPGWGLGQCVRLQDRLRREFGRIVEAAGGPGGYRVDLGERVLEISGWAEGDEVFRFSPLRGFPSDEKIVVRLICGHVARYMEGLRRGCIRKCERSECGKYFLDPAMREARYCSQPCRYRAYEEERERPKRKKIRKRG